MFDLPTARRAAPSLSRRPGVSRMTVQEFNGAVAEAIAAIAAARVRAAEMVAMGEQKILAAQAEAISINEQAIDVLHQAYESSNRTLAQLDIVSLDESDVQVSADLNQLQAEVDKLADQLS